MKNEVDDGGAVFPIPAIPPITKMDSGGAYRTTPSVPARSGMSLRDYFAAVALSGMLGNSRMADDMVKDKIPPEENQAWHATTAYQFADAMLKARKS